MPVKWSDLLVATSIHYFGKIENFWLTIAASCMVCIDHVLDHPLFNFDSANKRQCRELSGCSVRPRPVTGGIGHGCVHAGLEERQLSMDNRFLAFVFNLAYVIMIKHKSL
jgi:hypothetical protein